jgi:hypothetical protein
MKTKKTRRKHGKFRDYQAERNQNRKLKSNCAINRISRMQIRSVVHNISKYTGKWKEMEK